MIEEETYEKETVKNRFFCDLASLVSYDTRSYILFFRLHLDLVYYRIGRDDTRKDGLSYLIFLFTFDLSTAFSTIHYVCSWIHSSTPYSSFPSKGKNASTRLAHAYGCPTAIASFLRI